MDPEDDLFVDPEDGEEEDKDDKSKNQEDDVESENLEQQEQEEDEDDEQILAAWMRSQCRAAEKDKEEEKTAERIDRKISFDPPSRPRADRRASLPCPAQLSAMQLSRLHSATKAPTPARALRTRTSAQDDQVPATRTNADRRPSVISTIPEVVEVPERKARFRRRNVVSLSDADRICLICYDDLNNGGTAVRELPCSHSFHSECIEEWLWRKQACPTCRVQVPLPQPLYWSSARVKVP